MKAASSIVLPGAMGPTMLSIQPRSRTFSFGLMLPFYFGCVRLDGVAFTRASIRCKLYGALIVFAGSTRSEKFRRKKAPLGIRTRLGLAPSITHRSPPPIAARRSSYIEAGTNVRVLTNRNAAEPLAG